MAWYFKDGTPYKGGGKVKLTGEGRAKVTMKGLTARGQKKPERTHNLYSARVLNKINWRRVEAGLKLREVKPDGLKVLQGSNGKTYRTYEKLPEGLGKKALSPHYTWSSFERGPRGTIRKIVDLD